MSKDTRSIQKLMLYLNRLLGQIRIFIFLMYVGGVAAIILNLQVTHRKETDTWKEIFQEELKNYSLITKMSISLAGSEASTVFTMDMKGNILESTSQSLIGFNLKNSSLFSKISQLPKDSEFITMDYGLTENRLKAYYIRRYNGEYRVINYLPEDFFPFRSFNTEFVILNSNQRVIYSTEQNYIGVYLSKRSFFYKQGRVFLSSPLELSNSDIKDLYILRDISEQLYIIVCIGLFFAVGLYYLNFSLIKIRINLNLLKKEARDLNNSISRLSKIESNPKTLEESYIKLFNQSLRDISLDIIKCKLSYSENRTNQECIEKLLYMISNLLERIEGVMLERRETERKYRKIFEHNRDGIFQFSPNGDLLTVNQALVTLFGLKSINELKVYLSEGNYNVVKKNHLKKLLNHDVDEILEETLLSRPDGTKVPALLSAYTINDIDGDLQFIQGNVRDLSAEQSAKNLRLEKDRLETISKAKSDFLANISHELRTPLNSVIGFAELLDATVDGDKQRSYVKAILTSGKSLLTLIKDILDLSKLEADKMTVEKTSTSLRKLLLEIEQMFAVKVRDKNLEYKTDIEESIPDYIISDEAKIRQILINLVGNALKFTSTGFVHLYATSLSGSDIQIKVIDSGRGISKEGLKNVFSEFHQEGLQHGIGGTGLGLPICKRLSEVLKGDLQVTSELGKGSTFSLILKNIEVDNSNILTNEKYIEEEQSFIHIRFKNQRVLIIDDEEFNRDLVKEALQMVNIEVFSAVNGREGFDISKEIKPDLILLDLKMPVMDGFETINMLNRDKILKDIPVLAFTASISDNRFKELAEYGFKGLLLKPVKMGKLLNELSKYLDHIKLKEIRDTNRINELELKLTSDDYDKVSKLWPKSGLFKVNELKELRNVLSIYTDASRDDLKEILEEFESGLKSFDVELISNLLKRLTLIKE